MTLKKIIQNFLTAAKENNEIALVDSAGEMSFAEMAAAVDKLQEELKSKQTPLVIIAEPNSRKHFITFFACILSDAVYCPFNSKIPPETLSNLKKTLLNGQAFPLGINAIFHTTGSTGTPKGVLIRPETVEANIHNATFTQNFNTKSVVLAHLDFAHSGGFFLQALPSLINFSKLVIAHSFVPKKILKLIDRYKPTHTILLPAQLGLLERSKDFPFFLDHQFKIILSGSQNINAKFIKKALNNCEYLLNVYGLTECGPFAFFHLFKKPFNDDLVPMGKAVKELEWKISEEGELWVKGLLVTPGYLNAEPIVDYFKTKDIVNLENGVVYYAGRKNELFQVGALTVNPLEIEEKVKKNCSAVEDCLFFPIPHSQLVNITAALIKLQKGQSAHDLNLQPFLEKHSLPQVIIYVDEIPLNINGKPDRLKALEIYKKSKPSL